jgi:hypothetical protein
LKILPSILAALVAAGCSSHDDPATATTSGALVSATCSFTGWNGDEPADFTHFLDEDHDGRCDRLAEQVSGTYPNGLYPSCEIPGGGRQLAHAHWEYTHLQRDAGGETEEKDYLRSSLDFESLRQSLRFAANEPVRFGRLLLPSENPEGRYWQVDEWIGPTDGSGAPIPGLSWGERFFVCTASPAPCTMIDGAGAYGGYWSTHNEEVFHSVSECGDPFTADPSPARNKSCGTAFAECGS